MDVLLGTPSVHSMIDDHNPLELSLSPNGRFIAVLTQSTLSLWTAGEYQTMVAISIRNQDFIRQTGRNKSVIWDRDGAWLGVLVCIFHLLFDIVT